MLSDSTLFLTREGQAAIAVSNDMFSSEFWLSVQSIGKDLGEILALPGYPSFLKLTTASIGAIEGSLLYGHLILGGGVGGVLCLVLRGSFPPAYVAFAQSITWLMGEQMFRAVTPDWMAFCLVTLALALAIRFFSINQHGKDDQGIATKNIFKMMAISLSLGVVLSSLVLTKQGLAFGACAVVLIFSAENWHREGRWCLFGFMAPLVFWVAINIVRIGGLNLMPLTDLGIFGVISQFSHAEVRQDDEPRLKAFIEYVNQRKVPSPEGEHGWIESLADSYGKGFNVTNTWLVADRYRLDGKIPTVDFLRYVRTYYYRAGSAQWSRWFIYLQEGLINSLLTISIGLISLLLLMRKSQVLSDNLSLVVRGVSLIILLHILTAIFQAATNGWSVRYEMITGSNVWLISMLVVWVIYKSKGLPEVKREM